jgi:hypothetical protein
MRKHLRRLAPIGVLAVTGVLAAAMLIDTGPGAAATQAKPVNQRPPTISGTAQVGSTLTARDGEWTGNPTNFAYAWRRCDTDGGSCSTISGAADKTYVLKQVDQGNTIRLRVTARNGDGQTAATSVPTAVVQAAAPPTANPCDKNPPVANDLKPPERLLVAGQQVSPSVVGGSTQTIVARFRITACDGKPIQGALVYVTAVPYNMFSVPPEATTGADGWAELRMNRERGFPASQKQQLLVMFVRARGPGGNLLGGISPRRLVSFPVDLRK